MTFEIHRGRDRNSMMCSLVVCAIMIAHLERGLGRKVARVHAGAVIVVLVMIARGKNTKINDCSPEGQRMCTMGQTAFTVAIQGSHSQDMLFPSYPPTTNHQPPEPQSPSSTTPVVSSFHVCTLSYVATSVSPLPYARSRLLPWSV